jgi:hypothetical protein
VRGEFLQESMPSMRGIIKSVRMAFAGKDASFSRASPAVCRRGDLETEGRNHFRQIGSLAGIVFHHQDKSLVQESAHAGDVADPRPLYPAPFRNSDSDRKDT